MTDAEKLLAVREAVRGLPDETWWMNGRNVYNGDDYGSLILECQSAEIAFSMVEMHNALMRVKELAR